MMRRNVPCDYWNTWEVSVSYMLANLKRLPRCRRQKSEDASSEALGFSKMRSSQRRRQGRGDSEFIATLGEVKDVIGEWHDWEELAGIAEELSQHTGCKLLKEIHATAQDKFEHALATTNRMRKSSLGTSTKGRRRRSSIQSFSRV